MSFARKCFWVSMIMARLTGRLAITHVQVRASEAKLKQQLEHLTGSSSDSAATGQASVELREVRSREEAAQAQVKELLQASRSLEVDAASLSRKVKHLEKELVDAQVSTSLLSLECPWLTAGGCIV